MYFTTKIETEVGFEVVAEANDADGVDVIITNLTTEESRVVLSVYENGSVEYDEDAVDELGLIP